MIFCSYLYSSPLFLFPSPLSTPPFTYFSSGFFHLPLFNSWVEQLSGPRPTISITQQVYPSVVNVLKIILNPIFQHMTIYIIPSLH